MPTTDMKQLLIRVIGRVQGVGYRYACRSEAQRLGILGWVRNCHDGSVQCCIQGDERKLQRMQLWLQDGPELAHVGHMEIIEEAADSELQAFSIRFDE